MVSPVPIEPRNRTFELADTDDDGGFSFGFEEQDQGIDAGLSTVRHLRLDNESIFSDRELEWIYQQPQYQPGYQPLPGGDHGALQLSSPSPDFADFNVTPSTASDERYFFFLLLAHTFLLLH